MDCPNCGSPILNNQPFCRSCGTQIAPDEPRRLNPQLEGLAMAFVGIVIALTGSYSDLRVVLFLGVIISIAGMFLIAASPMLRSTFKKRGLAPKQPVSLPHAPTTNKLSPIGDIESVPASVTEGTTNLLKEPVARRSESDS